MSKICSKCQAENVDEAKFCRKCGQKFEQENKIINDVCIAQSNDEESDTSEDSFYEQAMEEIETSNTQKALWSKALAQSEGEKVKTDALYIKFRVQALKIEKQKFIDEEKIKQEILVKQEKEKAEEELKKIAEVRETKLPIFLNENNLRLIKKISDEMVFANYNNSPIDAYLQYKNNEWKIVERGL